VTLVFNEPVALASEGLRVVDASGVSVDAGPEQQTGEIVRQALVPLADGWYVVSWGIVSEDGHVVRGSSTFAVGDVGNTPAPSSEQFVDPTSLALDATRALADLALLVAAGAVGAIGLLGARTTRVRRLAIGATITTLVATAAWAGFEYLIGGNAWATTPYALATAARIGLLALGLVLVRWFPVAAAAAVVAALLTLAFGGHTTESLLESGLQSAHLVAGAVWLGAAPAVLLVLTDRSLSDEPALGVVRRFSRLAAVSLLVLAVAGSVLAWLLTDGLAGGLTLPWVLILAAKIALVVVAALGGWLGRRSLAREPRRERFRWLFGLDAGLLVGVAVLSSMLTTVSPDVTHDTHGSHATSARCALNVGEQGVALIATPGAAGENELSVSGVADGALGVTVELESHHTSGAPLDVELAEANGTWQGTAALPFAGPYQATIVVRVDTFTEARGSCTLELTG